MMNLQLCLILVLFVLYCNGDEDQISMESNTNERTAAAKDTSSSVNALDQPSLPLPALNSLQSIIANGGNYIIDASAFGKGFLISQNGNLSPASVPNQYSPTPINENKNVNEKLVPKELAYVLTPTPQLKPVVFSHQRYQNLVPIKIPVSLLGAGRYSEISESTIRNVLQQSPNSGVQINQVPVKLLGTVSQHPKLAPVIATQLVSIPIIRTIDIQMPNIAPLTVPRLYIARIPVTTGKPDPV